MPQWHEQQKATAKVKVRSSTPGPGQSKSNDRNRTELTERPRNNLVLPAQVLDDDRLDGNGQLDPVQLLQL